MVLINQIINLKLGGITVSATSTEINYNAGVVAGIADANKTLVLNSSKNITGINSLSSTTIIGTLATTNQPNITNIGTITDLKSLSSYVHGSLGNGFLKLVALSNILYLQPALLQSVGSATHLFITNYDQDTSNSARIFGIMSDGKVGIQSTNPQTQLEINSSTGNNLRLTYNNSNGTATNYTDILTTSNGNLTINTSGDFTTITKQLKVNKTISNFNTGGLIVRSLSNTNFRGRVIKKEIISTINLSNYDPDNQTDNYSLEIYGYILPLYTQSYTFYISHDDYVRVYIDGELIFNNLSSTGIDVASTPISLIANLWTPIYIQTTELIDSQSLIVKWQSTSQALEIIPYTNLAWDDIEPSNKFKFYTSDKLTIYNSTSSTSQISTLSTDSSGNLTISSSSGLVTINNTLNVTNLIGTLQTALQPNITSVGTLTSVTTTGTCLIGTSGSSLIRLIISGGINYIQSSVNTTTGSSADLFIGNYGQVTTSSLRKIIFKADGNVGIGTIAPDKQLEINSNTGDCLRLTYNDTNGSATNYTDLNVSSSGNLTINPSGTFTTLSGKLGINTTTINADIEISNTVPEIRITDNRTTFPEITGTECGKLTFYSLDSSLPSSYGILAAIVVSSSNTTVAPDGKIEFKTGLNGVLNSSTLTIDGANVGIGITTPINLLHLNQTDGSTTRLALFKNNTTAGTAYIEVSNQANTRCLIGCGGTGFTGAVTDVVIGNWTSGGDLVLLSGQSQSVRISSSGNVGIGGTPTNQLHLISSSSHQLLIQNTSANQLANIKFQTTTNTWELGIRGTSATSNPNTFYIYEGSSYKFLIKTSGEIGINTSSPTKQFEINSSTGNCLRLWYNLTKYAEITVTSVGELSFAIGDSNQNIICSNKTIVKTTSVNAFRVFDASNNYAMTVNTSNLSVGIGTSLTTNAALEVKSTSTHLRLTHTDAINFCDFVVNSNGYLNIIPSGSIMNLETNVIIDNTNTEALLVRKSADSGDVFIVDTTNTRIGIGGIPSEMLHLKSIGPIKIKLEADTDNLTTENDNAGIIFSQDNGGTIGYIGLEGSSAQTFISSLDNAFILGSNTANDLQLCTNNNVRLTINNSGLIGINTTGPNKQLEINSTTGSCLRLTYNDNNGSALYYCDFTIQSSGSLIISPSGSDTYIESNLVIDNTNIEALLVRKNADAGNIFIVDTTNVRVGINCTPTTCFHIKQTSDTSLGGIRIERLANTNTWNIHNGGASNLEFTYNGSLRGFLSNSVDVGQIDFTGQHRSYTKNTTLKTNIANYIGLIVSCTGEIKNINNENVSINQAIPIVDLSNTYKDKKVFGVISDSEDQERVYNQGAFSTVLPINIGDERLIINSIGEGMIWICDKYGSFDIGDLITTSDINGYGVKQDNEFICNYTVGKITEKCDFTGGVIRYVDNFGNIINLKSYNINGGYKCKLVACVYYCG
jgi:hypothetical protein